MFLLDKNLSPKIARSIEHLFPGCIHVGSVGLDDSGDPEVWDFARQNNLHILPKDADFSKIITFRGFPPKVVWLKCGNVTTKEIVEKVLDNEASILNFLPHPTAGILEIY